MGRKEEGDTDNSNLFRAELLSLFPNAESLTIWAQCFAYSFSFSLMGLLSLIAESSLLYIVIKADNRYGSAWTQSLWDQDEKQMQSAYSANGFSISAKDKMGKDKKEFWLVIHKQG